MRITITFIFAFLGLMTWAQRPSDFKELKERFPEYDYVVIKDHTDVSITHDKEKGVKILKTKQIEAYHTNDRAGLYKSDRIYSSFFERLIDKEAYSLNKKTGKDRYKKNKIRDFKTEEKISEQVFFDDGTVTSFEYEGLKPESVVAYEYTQELTDPHLSISGFFGSSIPVLNKTLTISVEKGIELNTVYFNMDSSDVNYSVEEGRKETIYKWKADSVEIFEREPSSPSASYYMPHLISRISYYENEKGEKVGVLEDVNDLFQWYETLVSQVVCKDEEHLKNVVEEIISPEDSELEKVKKVFQWVQNNVKYIAIEDGLGGFIPRNPDLVLNRRYGDCKDMSTLIVQLLEIQGIDAHQTWIGSIDIPYKYEEVPSPVVDNHMIAAYFNKETEEYIFLDATDEQIAFGYPSSFIQGKEALIKVEDDFEIVTVPVVSAQETVLLDTATVFLNGDTLRGSGELQLTGYYAADFKRALGHVKSEKNKKSQVESITKKGSNKYQMENYEVKTAENEIRYIYDFSIPSYINKTPNETYVNLNLNSLISFFSPYEEEDRKTAVMEDYATVNKSIYKLKIPEGYEIDYVPKDFLVDGGEEYYVKINYNVENPDEIIYNFELYLDYIFFEANRVEEIENLGKKLKDAYKETIILKKIENDE